MKDKKKIWPNDLCGNCDKYFTYRLLLYIAPMKEYIELAPYKCTSNYDCMHLFLIALPYIFNPDWHPLSNTYLVDGLLKHYAKALRRIPIYIRSEMEEDMKDKKCAKCNDSADALYELCDANKSQHYFCSSHEDIIGNAYTLLKRNTR